MPLQQQLQLLLLLQHRSVSSIVLFIRIAVSVRIICVLCTALRLSLPPLYVFPPNLALLHVLVIPRLVSRVVHTDQAASNCCTTKVVHSQVRATLVFVLEPAEAPALAGVAVARQLQEDGLAELGEDCDDIAFGELKWEAAKEYEGGVAVVDVPGGIGRAGSATTGQSWSSWGRS